MLLAVLLVSASLGCNASNLLYNGSAPLSIEEVETSEASSESETSSESEAPNTRDESNDTETSEEEESDVPETSDEDENEPLTLDRGENLLSIAAGETLALEFTINGLTIGEELGLSWTNENIQMVVNGDVVDGTYVTIQYSPRLSVVLSTVNGEAEEFVLTIGEPRFSIVNLGENVVDIPANKAGWGVAYLFTADETALYKLTVTHENCLIFWNTEDEIQFGYVRYNAPQEIGLEEGQTILLSISTENYQADTVSFTLTLGEEFHPYALEEGYNLLQLTKEEGISGLIYTFTAPTRGSYAINSWDCADPTTKAIVYTVNKETKYITDTQSLFTLQEGEVVTFTAYVYDDESYLDGVATIDLNVTRVILTSEEITIPLTYGEGSVYFFAQAVGSYTFTITEGALVMTFDYTVRDYVAVDTIVVESVGMLVLSIHSDTLSEATITIENIQ